MRAEHTPVRKSELDRKLTALKIVALTAMVFLLGTYSIFNSSYSRGPSMEYREPMWQFIGAAAGVGAVLMLYWLGFKLEPTKKHVWLMIIISVLLIFSPLFPGLGVERNGAKRWIMILGIMIQPSEIVKLILIMTLASVLEPIQKSRSTMTKVAAYNGPVALLIVGVIAALIALVQDDLGTAFVIGLIGVVLCAIAGTDMKHILISLGAAAVMVVIAVIMEPYRLVRIRVWLDPLAHLKDEGMQTAETLMGIGNAGWLGVGLGQGRIKWNIPAANTDFAYATIVEELGLIGAMLFAVAIFVLAYYCVLGAARFAKSRYTMLVGTGVGIWLMVQSGMNMMVVLNIFPPTGFPLPFASSGGTAILMNIIAIGFAVLVVIGDRPAKGTVPAGTKASRRVPRKRTGSS